MNNIYDIWFARIEIANSIKTKLIKKFSTKEIFDFKEKDLLDLNLKKTSIDKILEYKYRLDLDKYLDYMDKNNILQIFFKDECYPKKLKYISSYPTYIFIRRKY